MAQDAKSGSAKTSGACSPGVSGNKNTFVIKCNVGTDQGKKMVDLLNEILRKQPDQKELMSKIDRIIEATAPPTGVLTPANDPMPLTCGGAGVPDSMTRIYAGNSMQAASPDHETGLLAIVGGEKLLWVTTTSEGLLVSAKIYDDNGALVVITDNRFEANKNLGFSPKRPDPHTLIVYNNWDKEVFRIRFLNPKAVRVTGVFHYPGISPVIITDDSIVVNGNNFMSICNASPNYAALIGITTNK